MIILEQEAPLSILKRHWGYDSFRPMQEDIIQSILADNDTLCILPTGGGKSLCFQLPALLKDGLAVVISPLISLMKDQVDDLNELGISAVCLNSSLNAEERKNAFSKIFDRSAKLLYISPERLVMESTLEFLKENPPAFFVIDEAHCISHWGHDFRSEYRKLRILKNLFPNVPVHAFTATATPSVQTDIQEQLSLSQSTVFIGTVDRPNLTYHIARRMGAIPQIIEILKKHPDEPGIIYCLRRDDVDKISKELNRIGVRNVPYHAGFSDKIRHQNQDLFMKESVHLVVATIAFGMGIDRSNIRFIIHAAMPKNLEQYQQETGRAGRDGLSSHCYLLHNGADYHTWNQIISDSSNREILLEKLQFMSRFTSQPQCRHKAISSYFGQEYTSSNCNACDYCLKEFDFVEDPLTIAQKILSAVVRINHKQTFGFGAHHIANVLRGTTTEAIERWNHHQLSVFNIMPDFSLPFIRSIMDQLIGQNFLKRDGEFSSLSVTEEGWNILKGTLTPILAKPLDAKKKKEITRKHSEKHAREWTHVDQKLYEMLRKKRKELADQKNVPAFIIFGDKTLMDLAVKKPTTLSAFAEVFGIGERKTKLYGAVMTRIIQSYLEE